MILTLASSANAEEVSVMPLDSIDANLPATNGDSTTAVIRQDTLKEEMPKRAPWYVRFYRFADRVLSPPRDLKYIDVQDYYNWCAMVQFTNRFELYEMDSGRDFNMRVAPNGRWRIGPFFGWRFAFLGYNFDMKSVFIKDDDTDLCGSVYSAAFGLDLFYRRVGGRYNIRHLSVGDVDYTSQLRDMPFDGVNMGMTRVSFYYIMNYKHYSHQAAFNQTHRQLISAGSPILGIQYAHNKTSVDVDKLTAMVGMADNEYLESLLQQQKNDEISFTGGYGYNWVFAKNWLAGAELTGSIGYLHQSSDVEEQRSEDGEEDNPNLFKRIEYFTRKNIAFNGNFRFSVLYNNGPWFTGAQAVGFYYQYGNGTVMTRNLLSSVYFFVGCNF